ncbi:hypothetical protein K438DRAFT_1865049 [Mycena galopus ATCC 62051]|nr:hypothetical protein K438DRAFT_1865049 [Mycena galopus ATCC 62051]
MIVYVWFRVSFWSPFKFQLICIRLGLLGNPSMTCVSLVPGLPRSIMEPRLR